MRRADLLRGDRPWQVVVDTDRWTPQRPVEALAAVLVVLSVLAVLLVAPGLGTAVAALLAWAWLRPTVWLAGGGREPLSTTEWLEWNAHLGLSAKEEEHRQKEAKAKGGRR